MDWFLDDRDLCHERVKKKYVKYLRFIRRGGIKHTTCCLEPSQLVATCIKRTDLLAGFRSGEST